MVLRKWDDLPEEMRIPEVRKYYDILARRPLSLAVKRILDVAISLVLLLVLAVPLGIIALLIAMDSPGGVFFRQVRVTAYGKEFRIHKFRTMEADASRTGSPLTVGQDRRITRVGRVLRKYRLDELPQLLDVLAGNMSCVGTRPELPRYVCRYTDEMKATLLLPAGITSRASILYKDEAELLDAAEDVDRVYIERVLPGKMYYNLRAIEDFRVRNDFKIMAMTVLAVLGIELRGSDAPEEAVRQ